MKRFPNGVAGAAVLSAPRARRVPPGVRTEVVGVVDKRPQIHRRQPEDAALHDAARGDLAGSLVLARRSIPSSPTTRRFDLDPSDGVPFARVLDVARWIRDELDALGATGVAKTSGADGLHIYVPLPAGTPYEAGLLFCQIVATVVAQKHPKVATIERSVKARGKRVYVDYLQNILGKTLATAYSARASDYAGVSTPLTWEEIDEGFEREDFTIRPRRRGSRRSAICGRSCGSRRASTCQGSPA